MNAESSTHFLQKIRLAFGLAAAAMLIFGLASYVAVERLVAFGQFAVRNEAQLLDLERVSRAVSDGQTTVRNYLLAGRASDLARFDGRVDEIHEALASLRSDHAVPQQGRLEELVARMIANQREAIRLRTQGDPQGAVAVLISEGRNQVTHELADLVSEMRVQGQQQWRASRAVPVERWAQVLAATAAVLLFGLFGWVLYVARHYVRERHEAQARMAYTEAMSRTLAANMADGLITVTADLGVVDVNAAALQLLGHTREELVGRNLASLVAADVDGIELTEYLAGALQRPDSFRVADLQALGLHHSGRLVPLRISLNDLHVAGQRMVALLVHDMTAVQRATDALHASESQLRQIADALPVMIAEMDPQQRFRFHNRALDEFLGLSFGEVEGAHLAKVLGTKRYEAFRSHVELALDGELVQFDVAVPSADGERQYHVQLIPRLGHRGQVIGCLAHGTDITPLRRIDRMKTEFVSIVSHELRTPLTSIRGSLGLIAGGVAGKLPAPLTDLVNIAKNNCDRLVRLINDILDIEKIESGKLTLRLQRLDVTGVMRQAMAANEGYAGQHGVTCTLEAPADPALAQIDSDRLIQVATNLLSNAIKFSPAQGTVAVRVSRRAGMVRVEVQDQGPGIPAEFRERIFQKFSQADSSDTRTRGGTGLGLSITKQLVERMGGSIDFCTEGGAGTTFWFELPAAQEAPAAVLAGSPHPPPLRPRVLVCEADVDTGATVRRMLDVAGFDTDVAQTAGEALRLLETKRFDVLTLDPALQGADDAAFLEHVRKSPSGRHLPVVVIAERGEAERLRGHVSLAVALWLERPLDERRLVDSLREAIGSTPDGVPQILHVEDDPDIQCIVATIARDTAHCVSAASLDAARAQLQLRRFDLVLLDLALADGCGWDLLEELERVPGKPPVIVFSASDAEPPAGCQVEALLVKSHTSEADLLQAIQRVLPPAAAAPDPRLETNP